MANTALVTKKLIPVCDSARKLADVLSKKLPDLIASQPWYALFTEENEVHPYYKYPAYVDQINNTFLDFYKALSGLDFGNGTVHDELVKISTQSIDKGEVVDSNVEFMLSIQSQSADCKDAATKLKNFFGTAIFVWSFADYGYLKRTLGELFGQKNVEKHLEVPFVNFADESKGLVKCLKQLSKVILDAQIEGNTMRDILEKEQVLNGLSNNQADAFINALIKL